MLTSGQLNRGIMYWFSVLSVSVFAAIPLGLATPISPRWDDMRVKHLWESVPEKWESQGQPPVGTTIDLRIALKPHRENALTDALYEVSDPAHTRCVSIQLLLCAPHVYTLLYSYGAHLSKEQVAELVAPHPDTLDIVGSWLAHHDVPSHTVSITLGGGWLTIKDVPLTKANTLLGASYQNYRHKETGETVIRTVVYSLPFALHDHVQTVAPTTYFGSPRALLQTSILEPNAPTLPNGDTERQDSLETFALSDTIPSSCSSIITPTCLRLLYKTYGYVPQAPSVNRIGITGYLEQYASHSDLTAFLTRFRTDAVVANFSFVTINGGKNNESDPGLEVRFGLHVESEWGSNILSHRPISISNTPNQ